MCILVLNLSLHFVLTYGNTQTVSNKKIRMLYIIKNILTEAGKIIQQLIASTAFADDLNSNTSLSIAET